MILTFTHDDLFAIATDEKGRRYRVLLASGAGRAGYRLEPWDGDRAVSYRGRYVWEGDPLYPAIDAAHKARPVKPAPTSSRFSADFA